MGQVLVLSRRIGLGALLVLGTATWSSGAWAYDDGYQNVFSSVLGALGVLPPDKTPEIDYRERAPLVLPPKQNLDKPEKAGALRTAAWPRDPDVAAREAEDEASRAPMISMFDKRVNGPDSKTEMLKHRAAQTDPEPDATGCQSFDHSDAHCRLTADMMRKQDARYNADNPTKKNDDTVTAGVEPERLYLTQPPAGYMKATKTVRATHEAPDVRRDESSPLATMIQRQHGDQEDSPNK